MNSSLYCSGCVTIMKHINKCFCHPRARCSEDAMKRNSRTFGKSNCFQNKQECLLYIERVFRFFCEVGISNQNNKKRGYQLFFFMLFLLKKREKKRDKKDRLTISLLLMFETRKHQGWLSDFLCLSANDGRSQVAI